MATFTYKHAVKVNGEIIPPNTPVDIPDEKPEVTPEKKEKPAVKKKS